jgi:DNA-binding CsgD family transcriptional regulator
LALVRSIRPVITLAVRSSTGPPAGPAALTWSSICSPDLTGVSRNWITPAPTRPLKLIVTVAGTWTSTLPAPSVTVVTTGGGARRDEGGGTGPIAVDDYRQVGHQRQGDGHHSDQDQQPRPAPERPDEKAGTHHQQRQRRVGAAAGMDDPQAVGQRRRAPSTTSRAGARGYVTKSISPAQLSDAVRRVNDGDAVFSPRLAGFVPDAFAGAPAGAAAGGGAGAELDQLTPREREVLRLIARGYAYKQVARSLGISIKTVETHVSAVLHKLQLSSHYQLTRWATGRRLVEGGGYGASSDIGLPGWSSAEPVEGIDGSGRLCHTGYTTAMKVAISLPDALFVEADKVASRLGLNRSQLYARAIQRFLSSQDADPVTSKLDELATPLGSDSGAAAGRRLIEGGAWEW